MLQAYSSNLSVSADTAFPFNNITIDKGCAETLSAPASIQLNQRGVYLIEIDGFGTGATAGADIIQLSANGVLLPQAVTSFTASTTGISNFSIKTLLQVASNNCPCNCSSSPTVLQIMNGDIALTDAHVNIIVTKIH